MKLRLYLIFVFCWLAHHTWAVDLTAVRVSNDTVHTRLVMDLSGPVKHQLFDLKKPDRVVVDLHNTLSKVTAMPPGRGHIKKIRSGKPQDSTLRVVLDLNGVVKMRSYQITPEEGSKHQLVVELYTEQSSALKPIKSAAQSNHGRQIVIAIDAGHGGIDPGATGKQGTREKDVVLEIAKRLKNRLQKESGFEAVLTRDNDQFYLHRDRMRIAREHRADLFVSIHADAFKIASAHGSTVYVLSERGASSEAAQWLAERENAADLVGGVTLHDKDDVLASVLLDLSQTASLSASIEAGNHVAHQLGKVGRLRRQKVQQANFLVLKSPDIPSILVETAFISNPKEEQRLRQAVHQEAWAQAIADGITKYFYANPPVGTLVARQHKMSRPTALTYTIARGDTLSGIADRFNIRLTYLRKVNNIRGDRIRIGQVIRIPESSDG